MSTNREDRFATAEKKRGRLSLFGRQMSVSAFEHRVDRGFQLAVRKRLGNITITALGQAPLFIAFQSFRRSREYRYIPERRFERVYAERTLIEGGTAAVWASARYPKHRIVEGVFKNERWCSNYIAFLLAPRHLFDHFPLFVGYLHDRQARQPHQIKIGELFVRFDFDEGDRLG